jgi:AcrR family transcriptional regulator
MDNRSHILHCALALFSARGYDAVGIQEIVEAAGVTKPTHYHYFTNKRGLLNCLLETHFNELFVDLSQAADYRGDITLTLEKIAHSYFTYAKENPAFYRMQLSLYFAPPDSEPNQAVAHFNLEQHQAIEKVFSLAVKDHGNMRGRQREYAAAFRGMINTYIALFLNGYVELTDGLVYQSVHQFMHGIFS